MAGENVSAAVIDARDGILAVHIASGSGGLVLGGLALWSERPPAYRSRAGSAYPWAVLAIALTAIALVALDGWELWWLAALAVLSYGLALVGYLAPDRSRKRTWIRLYAHGQGGAYIALVTALLVVALAGPATIAAAIVPTIVGLPLIERRVARITRVTTTARRET